MAGMFRAAFAVMSLLSASADRSRRPPPLIVARRLGTGIIVFRNRAVRAGKLDALAYPTMRQETALIGLAVSQQFP